MPRIRSIKHDLYLDEDLARLPLVCRYAFPGLWTLADREGRLEDRPARLKAQLFPYEPEVDMDDLLARLAAGGFIVRYEVGVTRYLQVRTFAKHQQVNARESKSTIPPPPGHTAPPTPVPSSTVPTPDESETDTGTHGTARARTCMQLGNGNGNGNGSPPSNPGGGASPSPVTLQAPRLVPRGPGTRAHPLDEDQAAAQAAPDVQQRAALWLEAFADMHHVRRGSRYLTKPQRDFEPAVRLVRAYSPAEMHALTALYLDASGVGFDDKPRTPGHLAHVAPMLEERLKEVGQWPSAA